MTLVLLFVAMLVAYGIDFGLIGGHFVSVDPQAH